MIYSNRLSAKKARFNQVSCTPLDLFRNGVLQIFIWRTSSAVKEIIFFSIVNGLGT